MDNKRRTLRTKVDMIINKMTPEEVDNLYLKEIVVKENESGE